MMINQPRLSSPILVNFKSINPTASSLSESVILHYSYGYFYPVPLYTVRSLEIAAYQSGQQGLSTRIFHNA